MYVSASTLQSISKPGGLHLLRAVMRLLMLYLVYIRISFAICSQGDGQIWACLWIFSMSSTHKLFQTVEWLI